jgi:Ca-activated chloride channel homolog
MMDQYKYANPEFFYLYIVVGIMVIWYLFKQHKSTATIQNSTLRAFSNTGRGWKFYARHSMFMLRVAAMSLLIIALARPQSTLNWADETTEGIDIVLSLDISGSMLAEDFKPNRLEAAKDVAIQFISGRPNDRIGLVVYGSESFTQCPLTTDHAVLINLFRDVKHGMIEDGTAIGYGLATSVSRLKESDAKSKVVILLTDGENTTGDISPATAADIAKTYGIRVYTIGVGTKGMAPYPMRNFFGQTVYQQVEVKIDEETLKEIASITGGQYFRATNKNKLEGIYEEINKLEKSKIDVKEYSKKAEEYYWFALFAGVFLLFEILLRLSVFRNVP